MKTFFQYKRKWSKEIANKQAHMMKNGQKGPKNGIFRQMVGKWGDNSLKSDGVQISDAFRRSAQVLVSDSPSSSLVLCL